MGRVINVSTAGQQVGVPKKHCGRCLCAAGTARNKLDVREGSQGTRIPQYTPSTRPRQEVFPSPSPSAPFPGIRSTSIGAVHIPMVMLTRGSENLTALLT